MTHKKLPNMAIIRYRFPQPFLFGTTHVKGFEFNSRIDGESKMWSMT